MLLPWMPAPITTTAASLGGLSILGTSSGSRELCVSVAGQEVPPPSLCALYLIERVDVEADHVSGLLFKQRSEVRQERVRPVAAPSHQPRHEAPVPPEVADRIAHADPEGHLQ